MSKYSAFKNAIETFQSGAADAPILMATTEVNDKGFKALLGRKLKWQPGISTGILIAAFAIIAVSAFSIALFGNTGTPAFAAFVPMIVIIFLIRTTFVTIGDSGLDFYFADPRLGSKYVVYDKLSLPYDKITNVKKRTGKFNTGFVFEFSADGKTYKIKTTVPNKIKRTDEQAENLKRLLEVLEERGKQT